MCGYVADDESEEGICGMRLTLSNLLFFSFFFLFLFRFPSSFLLHMLMFCFQTPPTGCVTRHRRLHALTGQDERDRPGHGPEEKRSTRALARKGRTHSAEP